MKRNFLKPFLTLIIGIMLVSCSSKEKKILVFNKTQEMRHGSIKAGIAALKKLEKEKEKAGDNQAPDQIYLLDIYRIAD